MTRLVTRKFEIHHSLPFHYLKLTLQIIYNDTVKKNSGNYNNNNNNIICRKLDDHMDCQAKY